MTDEFCGVRIDYVYFEEVNNNNKYYEKKIDRMILENLFVIKDGFFPNIFWDNQ